MGVFNVSSLVVLSVLSDFHYCNYNGVRRTKKAGAVLMGAGHTAVILKWDLQTNHINITY